MFFKIAKNNVIKSFKDFTIYFLTLTIAVCIFYIFNSIQAQEAILNLKNSMKEYLNIIQDVLLYVSIFVSIILAILMIYANNFLIKRRKKEFAIYMILGMKEKKVTKILFLETLIIGFFSLFAGIILGIGLSQIFPIIIAKLFMFKISNFEFIISISAIFKTIVYFFIIYIIIIIFNKKIISKYSLLELLTAEKKNEKLKIKNSVIMILINIIGIILLLISYIIMIYYGLKANELKLALILEIVGLFLFFLGLSGTLNFFVYKNKKFYYKDLNLFIFNQINNKINTNIISMTLISIVLFFAIIGFVSGISSKSSVILSTYQQVEDMINVYVGMYLGFVFLIVVVSILSLQQLSDASDNIKGYLILKKLGVRKELINKTIFKQVFIYFMIPFLVAIVNSIIFIYSASNSIINLGEINILKVSIFVFSGIIIIYLVYFYLTFISVKEIINKKLDI